MKLLSTIAGCCCALLVGCGVQNVGSRYVKSQNVTASQGASIAVSASESPTRVVAEETAMLANN